MYDVSALVTSHLEAVFTFDETGRIVTFQESSDPPPRFVLVRTRAGHRCVFRHDVPDRTAAALAALAGREPRVLSAWPAADQLYRHLLEQDAPVTEADWGRDHMLPRDLPDPGNTLRLGPEHFDALAAHYPVTVELFDQRRPVHGIIEDGAVVARCCSIGDEAGVDVAERYRRRGYATRVTAAWARHRWEETGRPPLYSHQGDNVASYGVAQRLGAIQYGVDYELT